MKTKFTKKPDPNVEEDESADVGAEGPSIASGKKSKMAIIAASSILITVVLYILFFKADDTKTEKLVEVQVPKGEKVAATEDGKSALEIRAPEKKSQDDLDLLSKPAKPNVPSLPDLPLDAIPKDQIDFAQNPQNPQDPNAPALLPGQLPGSQQLLPGQGVPGQQLPTQANPNSQPGQPGADPVKKVLDPRYAPIVVFSGGGGAGLPSRGVGYDNNIVNLNEDKILSLKETQTTVVPTRISDRSHTIAQGKLLTAVLETAINTEIPGSVRAIVSRDVYGESGNDVLIPRGSRLFGSYATQVSQGQGRVNISWARLIRPDGVDLAITFSASDQFGRSGIAGDLDSKYGSIITTSLLTSILAVGGVAAAQKLLGNAGAGAATTTTTNPQQGTTTTTGNATNQALYDVSKTIIDTVGQVIGNAVNVVPVIRVPQGTKITVIVNSDITVPSMVKN